MGSLVGLIVEPFLNLFSVGLWTSDSLGPGKIEWNEKFVAASLITCLTGILAAPPKVEPRFFRFCHLLRSERAIIMVQL